jgi:putative alpha-1,2-mannosidase
VSEVSGGAPLLVKEVRKSSAAGTVEGPFTKNDLASRGKLRAGTFAEEFIERRWEDYYTEGDAWQYLWYVPFDLEGLAEQMGGREVLLDRARELFDASRRERRTALPPVYYWHGNEPDLHAPFLFAALGAPADTARTSRWVARTMYGDGPRGLPGNDDGGTMSAWLVFASLGLFPIAGADEYVLGSPLVTHAELTLGDGTFVIDAPEGSDRAPYVAAARLDGAALEGSRVRHGDLRPGGRLELDMREQP